jgi:biopolymer transport protein ExbB
LAAYLVGVCPAIRAQGGAASQPARDHATDSLDMAPNDSAEAAARMEEPVDKEEGGFVKRLKRGGFGQWFMKGGVFMWPLLVSSIVGLVFIIERLWTLSRARIDIRSLMSTTISRLREKGVESARQELEQMRGPVAAILYSGLRRAGRGPDAVAKAIEAAGVIEMSFLERGLIAIATVGNVAPLLGFLGTVSGMINAFAAIAAADQVSAKIVAQGIEEALITTLAGLVIAIPANTMYNYFVMQINRFATEMEEASAELIDELVALETAAGR